MQSISGSVKRIFCRQSDELHLLTQVRSPLPSWSATLLVPLLLVGLHALWHPEALTLLYDTNLYLAGAKSFALGQGYHQAHFVGSPPIGLYPPLQSLLFSFFWDTTQNLDGNLGRIWPVMLLLDGLSLGLMMWLMRRLGSPVWLTVLTTVALGLNPAWYSCAIYLMSDLLFAALCFGTAAAWAGPAKPNPTALWLWTGTGLGLAYLCRTAALPLIAATTVGAVWSSRRIGGRSCVAFLIPALSGILAAKLMTAGGVSYGDNFREWWPNFQGWHGYGKLLLGNLADLGSGQYFWRAWCQPLTLIFHWFRARSSPLGWCVGGGEAIAFWCVVALIIVGIRRGHITEWLMATLLLGYLGAVVIAPMPTAGNLTERYLFITVPFAFHWAWRGVTICLPPPSAAKATRVALCGGSLLLMMTAGIWGLRVGLKQLRALGTWPDERLEAVTWLRKHGATNTTLAVGIDQPSIQLADALGRPLVIDYFDAPVRAFLPIPVTHKVQHYTRADFLLLPVTDRRMSLPPGLLREVMTTSGGNYRLLRVDAEQEKSWRQSRGIPPP